MRQAIATLLVVISCGAHAAGGQYPARPVRLVTTFAPGGGADIVGRALAQRLLETWGQPLVIDNRGGAGGVIGTEIVARAPADGYTLLLGTSGGMVLNPLLAPGLPYDPHRDFAPVTLVVINVPLLVAIPSLGVSSVRDLIVLMKSRPESLNYASVGQGSTTHLSMELFKSMTGTKAVHVPYKGAGPALNELMAGQVQLMFSNMPAVLPHVRSGKLRGLAVGSARRAAAAPDIPTVAESGVPDFESVSWFGVFAPVKTVPAIVSQLSAQIGAVMGDSGMRERFASQGAEARTSTPQELRDYMTAETERWRAVIQSTGLRQP